MLENTSTTRVATFTSSTS
ncbi:hypothetical protein LINPERHAP2_LOCUS28930 [Linum perenne]